jgi:hypothetical protein
VDFTFTDVAKYPQGTSVSAYPVSNWVNGMVVTSAAPVGAATNTQTMGASSLTFTGLTQDVAYVAHAEVGGEHRYSRFLTTLPGGPVQKGLVDAKGDLIVATGADTVTRRAVGANGTALVADSAEVDGVKWATVGVSDASVGIREQKLIARTGGWAPTGAIAENAPRILADTTISLTSGTLRLAGGLVLPGGTQISNISFHSGATAGATLTNQWFCLVDQSLNVLAKTADDTSTAWGARAVKTLALSSPYTPANDIAVYVGILVAATTTPNIQGVTNGQGNSGDVQFKTPSWGGTSTTGLTNPASLGATAAAITAATSLPYAYVS